MSELTKVDNVEVGSDLDFEKRWWKVERITWIVMVIVIAAGLAGALGRGALARAKAGEEGAPLRIEYERLARFRTPAVITAHLEPQASREGEARVWVSNELLTKVRIQRMIPEPIRMELVSDGAVLTFRLPPERGAARVSIVQEPGSVGPVSIGIGLDGSPPLRVSQFVFP